MRSLRDWLARKIDGWCWIVDDYQHYQDCHGYPKIPRVALGALEALARFGYWCNGWRSLAPGVRGKKA